MLAAGASDALFIDPSLSYRLELHRYRPPANPIRGVVVRSMGAAAAAAEINRLYALNGMVSACPAVMWANQRTPTFT